MPDIPAIPIPFIGRVIAVIKDVIVRLRNVSPVLHAQCIDYDESLNAYLIRMEVRPAERQYRFTELSVDGCDLMEAKSDFADQSFPEIGLFCLHEIFTPDTTQGKLRSIIYEAFIVAPKSVSPDLVIKRFYVIPKTPASLVKIHLKSAQWFASLSCEVALKIEE